MNRKLHRKKKHRRRRKLKRLLIAYLLWAILILIPLIMVVLMACGCLYIRDRFAGKAAGMARCSGFHRGIAADAAGNSPIVPTVSAEHQDPEFCVVIDPGHGGNDGGTVSGKVAEKDVNLSVARKLKAILELNHIEVILTRSSDDYMSLAQRTSVANGSNGDLFISLHCNYYEDDAGIAGMECYYHRQGAKKSQAFAESILHAASLSDDIPVRDAKAAGYYVLRNTGMPAVLVEMGFLSNAAELRKLSSDDYQEKLARRIAEGILEQI